MNSPVAKRDPVEMLRLKELEIEMRRLNIQEKELKPVFSFSVKEPGSNVFMSRDQLLIEQKRDITLAPLFDTVLSIGFYIIIILANLKRGLSVQWSQFETTCSEICGFRGNTFEPTSSSCHKKDTMAHIVLLVIACVLCSWETQGSSDVTTVFVQKGKNLHLDVNKPVDLGEDTEFTWTINNTRNVVRLSPNKTRITDSYAGRVEFSVQNHSLLLKNVQHSDSGDYTALITGDKTQHVAEYKVIIQDPVSPVQLSVNSVSNSRESCNLTVTCSTEDSLISSTFRCDNQTCNQEEGEQSEVTTSGSSLRVYLLNDSIICNHSNQVSWTRDMKEILPLCSLTAVPDKGTTVAIWIVLPVFLFLCLVLGCLIKYQKRKINVNTVYARPQELNPDQTPNQTATEDASVNTTYALVEVSTGPKRMAEPKKTTLPETIYSEVNKAPKSNQHPERKKHR
ncbi:SLAM family member 5-like [Scomber scombrus]|uniref:SLAM family member 5-like n=1 Tax=Scomber scombrus TaxID=13677 RepID=A0AAV1Q1K2_SCOSC